jgi:hypothetical protein
MKVKINIKKQCFYWNVKLKRIVTFTKSPWKKLEIKTMRTELKNIILSIWNEWWNWKPIKFLQKKPKQNLRNSKNGDQIEEYNIS